MTKKLRRNSREKSKSEDRKWKSEHLKKFREKDSSWKAVTEQRKDEVRRGLSSLSSPQRSDSRNYIEKITSPETITFQPDWYCTKGLSWWACCCHQAPLIPIYQIIILSRWDSLLCMEKWWCVKGCVCFCARVSSCVCAQSILFISCRLACLKQWQALFLSFPFLLVTEVFLLGH